MLGHGEYKNFLKLISILSITDKRYQ